MGRPKKTQSLKKYKKEEADGLYGPTLQLNTFEVGQIIGVLTKNNEFYDLNEGFQKKLNKFVESIYKKKHV